MFSLKAAPLHPVINILIFLARAFILDAVERKTQHIFNVLFLFYSIVAM